MLLSEFDLATRKMFHENNAPWLPTKSPKVNRSGEFRPGENEFLTFRRDGVQSHPVTTPENNEKFRLSARVENGFAGGCGGAEETGINIRWCVSY